MAGEAIAAHPGVDMVSFTGSTRAGRRVSELAAETVKSVTLELGGKSPTVILDDADLAKAVPDGVAKCFLNSGQTCNALTRMLVPREMLAEAGGIAAAAAESSRPATPSRSRPGSGRWSPTRSASGSAATSRRAREGAELVTGGAEPPEGLDRGYFVRPTVFSGVDNSMTIAQEEIFGPVLSIIPYDGRGRRGADRQRHDLRPRRGGLVGGRGAGAARRRADPHRPGGDQRRRLQPAGAVRRLQAVRPRARAGALRDRGVPAAEGAAAQEGGSLGSAQSISSLTDEQRLLRDTVRDFAREEVAPVAEELDRTKRFPYELVAKMGELGLMGIPFPEEYGGGGADTLAYTLAIEELARVDSSVAITVAAHTSLGTMPIHLWGTDEQKDEWLPVLCSGEQARRLRAHRARGGLRRRQHPHHARSSTTASG